MKKAFLILSLFPLAAGAQSTQQTNPLKSFSLHYAGDMEIRYDFVKDSKGMLCSSKMELPGPGDMTFGRDTGITPLQRAIKATSGKRPDWSKGYMTASKITLICPAYPDVKADSFVYDDLTSMARLTGNITIVDHGATKTIGETMYLDLSDDNYKIIGLR